MQPIVSANTSKKVILWNSNTGRPSSANVTYYVRPQPMPTPVSVIRPSIIGGHGGQNTSLITNVLKPVMTTGIYENQIQKKVDIPRIPPIILPKPPVVSVAPTMTLGAASTSTQKKPPPAIPSFIVTTTMPSKITTAPDPSLFGTTKYPIQLVQTGNSFQTLQPLNNSQVTQINKILRKNRGVKEPEIVYEDKVTNRKLVYKIMCKEDVLAAQAAASKINVSESSESSEDENDLEEARIKQPMVKEIVLNPHEVLKMTDPATILNKKRKRGRPTEFEKYFMMPSTNKQQKHSKFLKSQFGLTIAQAQSFEHDIVDDKTIIKVEIKDDQDRDIGEDILDEGALPTSYTRSGRLSRPPRTIIPNLDNLTSTPGSILDLPNLPPPPPPPDMLRIEPKARRKFTVPDKFRCRVCNKIYLGDRKMAKHVKAFPTHGPYEDHLTKSAIASNNAMNINTSKHEDEKKMPASLSMPIIPMARIQLEELVKNLDAELVLDCVSKKMFDNFSMWDLQLKKMQLNKEKGLKRLEVMLHDMENVLTELKKMVDNCLTHTKVRNSADIV